MIKNVDSHDNTFRTIILRVLATALMSLPARRTRSKRTKRIRRAALAFLKLAVESPIARKAISIKITKISI